MAAFTTSPVCDGGRLDSPFSFRVRTHLSWTSRTDFADFYSVAPCQNDSIRTFGALTGRLDHGL